MSKEYIPKGTRFGPLIGEIYTNDTVPKNANRKYFWRVSMENFSRFIKKKNKARIAWSLPFATCTGPHHKYLGSPRTQRILSKCDETS